jgi:hypothetical protein
MQHVTSDNIVEQSELHKMTNQYDMCHKISKQHNASTTSTQHTTSQLEISYQHCSSTPQLHCNTFALITGREETKSLISNKVIEKNTSEHFKDDQGNKAVQEIVELCSSLETTHKESLGLEAKRVTLWNIKIGVSMMKKTKITLYYIGLVTMK